MNTNTSLQIPKHGEPFGEFTIDPDYAAAALEQTRSVYDFYLAIDTSNLEGIGRLVPLNGMFERLPGMALAGNVTAMSQYLGQSSGGHTIYLTWDSSEESLDEQVRQAKERNKDDPATEWGWYRSIRLVDYGLRKSVLFDMTVDGFIAAFAFTFVLPTFGANWHGYMGRDHKLIVSELDLHAILAKKNEFAFAGGNQELIEEKGPGIRVSSHEDGYLLTCLGTMRNIGIVDLMLVLNLSGKIQNLGAKKLVGTTTRTLY